jgi:renalase
MINTDCLIVGAGISGLTAAQALTQQGRQCLILEKSRGVGGRMATRRTGSAVFDHGAQFFTVRSKPFQQMTDRWLQEGSALEWSRGFPNEDGRAQDSGHPRYRGAAGMTAIPKSLARGLQIHLNTKIVRIQIENREWVLIAENRARFTGAHLVLTSPVPQSLSLLDGCSYPIPNDTLEALQSICYDNCLAALLTLEGASGIPAPGAISFKEGPIAWIADNHQKGISPLATSITIHATAELSRDLWKTEEEAVLRQMLAATQRWLRSEVREAVLHRWRYSRPSFTPFDSPVHLPGPPSLTFAGDAFGAPRVEGAALSGLSCAQWLSGFGKDV